MPATATDSIGLCYTGHGH